MEEMLLVMMKEETFNDAREFNTPCNVDEEKIFTKEALAYDAVMRFERILN